MSIFARKEKPLQLQNLKLQAPFEKFQREWTDSRHPLANRFIKKRIFASLPIAEQFHNSNNVHRIIYDWKQSRISVQKENMRMLVFSTEAQTWTYPIQDSILIPKPKGSRLRDIEKLSEEVLLLYHAIAYACEKPIVSAIFHYKPFTIAFIATVAATLLPNFGFHLNEVISGLLIIALGATGLRGLNLLHKPEKEGAAEQILSDFIDINTKKVTSTQANSKAAPQQNTRALPQGGKEALPS